MRPFQTLLSNFNLRPFTMAYWQTGSGKTHTMFGPPGCLTEASVQQASERGGGVPESWGLFPRAVLTLLRTEGVQSLHASAVEVYHENVFDLMDDRAQLSIGSSTKQLGTKARRCRLKTV